MSAIAWPCCWALPTQRQSRLYPGCSNYLSWSSCRQPELLQENEIKNLLLAKQYVLFWHWNGEEQWKNTLYRIKQANDFYSKLFTVYPSPPLGHPGTDCKTKSTSHLLLVSYKSASQLQGWIKSRLLARNLADNFRTEINFFIFFLLWQTV